MNNVDGRLAANQVGDLRSIAVIDISELKEDKTN